MAVRLCHVGCGTGFQPVVHGMMAVPLSTSDETIVVQGIIDMLVRTPRGLLVIDFKTDRITAGEVVERAELYRKQLDLYGRAAATILKKKLLAKWLYFLTQATAFEIKWVSNHFELIPTALGRDPDVFIP